MPREGTVSDHGRRIGRVIDHMAAHLDEDLDLAVLAEVACFSPWHFHRIYRETVGETPVETLRRLRLHRATVDLLRTAAPLSDVARRAGYGSVAAFSRAFAAFVGLPPAAFRDQAARGPVPPGVPPLSLKETPAMSETYDVTFHDVPALTLAALPHQGDYNAIGAAFDRLMAWAGPRGLIGPDSRSFGIYYDDPAAVPAADLRSHACLLVPEGTAAPDGGVLLSQPPTRAAAVTHVGPYAQLEAAYAWLYGRWLPASGEEPADRPCFEEYLNDPRSVPPTDWRTMVFLPLRDARPD